MDSNAVIKALRANFATWKNLECDTKYEDSVDVARLFYEYLVFNHTTERLESILQKNRYKSKMKMVLRHIEWQGK
jgi:hypothetical protein